MKVSVARMEQRGIRGNVDAMKVSVARMEHRGIRGNVRHDNRVNASVVVKLFPDCDLRPFPQGDFLRGVPQGDFLRGAFGLLAGLTA